MQTSASDFLRKLGGSPLASGSSLQGSAGSLDFAQLLAQARAGEVRSGIIARVAPQSNVELSDEQLARVSAAADLAEAHGVTRGAFLIDGQLVAMDVPTRTITGPITSKPTSVVEGIDALVTVASKGAVGAAATITPPTVAPQQPMNPSLLDVLARVAQPRA
jgi:hypothetical protein